MSDTVKVYAYGLVFCSVCAPKGMDRAVVELQVNQSHPTGIASQWKVADQKFRDGSPNPNQCDRNPERFHYLMVC